jgi:hypothetical protein
MCVQFTRTDSLIWKVCKRHVLWHLWDGRPNVCNYVAFARPGAETEGVIFPAECRMASRASSS